MTTAAVTLLAPVVPSRVREKLASILVGGAVIVLWYVLSSRLLLISQSYSVYAGVLGGFLAAALFETRWDDGLESGFAAGLAAVPVAVACLVVYDIVLTSRYDVTLTDLGLAAPPETLLSKLFVYGVYEAIFGLYPLLIFVVGGMVGGVVGGKLGGVVRSWYGEREDPDSDPA